MFHCSTKFVTDKGIRSFLDYEDGEKVLVYNEFGELEEGTIIKSNIPYPYMTINRFVIGTSKRPKKKLVLGDWGEYYQETIKDVITCGTEYWYLYGGQKVEGINIGQSLKVAPVNTNNIMIDLKNYWWFIVGCILGSGQDYLLYNEDYIKYGRYLVDKIGDYVYVNYKIYNKYKELFDTCGFGDPTNDKASIVEIFRRGSVIKQETLNLYQWNNCPDVFKADLFEGFYQCTKKDNPFRLYVPNKRYVDFINATSKFSGMHVTETNYIGRYNNAKRKYEYYYEIIFDSKYKRHDNRRFWLLEKNEKNTRIQIDTNEWDYSDKSYAYNIDTDSKTFILANGIIVCTEKDKIQPAIR